jgi:hypothetical protein
MKQRMIPSKPVCVPRASDWVAPANRDTAWWIFKELFHCRVQRIQTVSIEEMKEYGTPTSGDPTFDAQMRHERVDRMLTIAQMVEYWEAGVTVGVVEEKNTKKIYELIANHLTAWRHKLDNELNNRGAPLDELMKLDKFANVVYSHARFHFTQEYVDSLLHRKLASARAARHNVLKPYEEPVVPVNQAGGEEPTDPQKRLDEKYPPRQSMADAFKRGQGASVSGGGTLFTPRWKS